MTATEVDLKNTLIRDVTKLIFANTGIQFRPDQVSSVANRLRLRMLKLGIKSYQEYSVYLKENLAAERQALISILTTHHSYFFREGIHFEYLLKVYLPAAILRAREQEDRTIRIWSAACSRGQEVYSLAMFFSHHLQHMAPDVDFEIVASDIDIESVEFGQNGVYHKSELNKVPLPYLSTHWVKGREDIADFVKARESLCSKITWKRINLLDVPIERQEESFDIIFCRNVFIYFDYIQVQSCVNRLVHSLSDCGLMVIGVSESLSGIKLDLKYIGYGIYSLNSEELKWNQPSDIEHFDAAPFVKAQPSEVPIRVVCVDDSATILLLLRKILGPGTGFEVVGTAANGVEAKLAIEQLKPDVVTMDIHMPIMDGVNYMATEFNLTHPPVVMISSVPREEADLAMEALRYGASDYVEKPSLNKLEEQADEIRSKLQMAIANKIEGRLVTEIDQAFSHKLKIIRPETKTRVIVAGMGSCKTVLALLSQLTPDQCPTVILFSGSKNLIDAFVRGLDVDHLINLGVVASALDVGVNQFGILEFKSSIEQVIKNLEGKKTIVCLLGVPTKAETDHMVNWPGVGIILEDIDAKSSSNFNRLREIAIDIMPGISMGYMSSKYLEN